MTVDITMDILNGYVNVAAQIDNLWNIFMGVHLVLFGLLFKYREEIPIRHRMVVLAGYSIFAFMNCRALLINYALLKSLGSDIIKYEGNKAPSVFSHMVEHTFDDRALCVLGIHMTVALSVVYYSFYDNRARQEMVQYISRFRKFLLVCWEVARDRANYLLAILKAIKVRLIGIISRICDYIRGLLP